MAQTEPDPLAERLAAELIDARRRGTPLEPWAEASVPATPDLAFVVDDLVAARSGWPVAGWKIGCTSEHAMQVLRSPGPFPGRVYSLLADGASIDAADVAVEPFVEGEIAFVVGSTIAPQDPPADRDAVLAAVEAVAPAIEVVGGRFAGFPDTPLGCIIADAGSNSHLVVGPRTDTEVVDHLTSAAATMRVDGAVAGQGTGADVLGDPVNALLWLVDNLSSRGIALEAGQIVTTGTATQLAPLPAGSTATATIDHLGSVTVHRA